MVQLALKPRPLDRRDPDYREMRENRLDQARRDYRAGLMTPFALRKLLLGCGLRPNEISDEINNLGKIVAD